MEIMSLEYIRMIESDPDFIREMAEYDKEFPLEPSFEDEEELEKAFGYTENPAA